MAILICWVRFSISGVWRSSTYRGGMLFGINVWHRKVPKSFIQNRILRTTYIWKILLGHDSEQPRRRGTRIGEDDSCKLPGAPQTLQDLGKREQFPYQPYQSLQWAILWGWILFSVYGISSITFWRPPCWLASSQRSPFVVVRSRPARGLDFIRSEKARRLQEHIGQH